MIVKKMKRSLEAASGQGSRAAAPSAVLLFACAPLMHIAVSAIARLRGLLLTNSNQSYSLNLTV